MARKTYTEYIENRGSGSSIDNVVGFVTKVYEHDGTENSISNHEVNVQRRTQDQEFRRIPVLTDHEGSIYVPQKGDAVKVGFLASKTPRPVVEDVIYTDEVRAPLGRSGHWRRRLDDEDGDSLWLEAEPKDHSAGDPETLRMAVKKEGLDDPAARIEIDLSGTEPVIRLTRGEDEQGNTDMGLELDFGSGEFKLGDGSGYGIVSDGSGNFDWYYETLNEITDGSTISW